MPLIKYRCAKCARCGHIWKPREIEPFIKCCKCKKFEVVKDE